MTKVFAFAAALLFSFESGYAQDRAKAQAFEVASITPCQPGTPEPPGEHMGMVQLTYPGGRFAARAASVKYLLEWAYGIQPPQHEGGPSWLDIDRYDITAKAEGNASDAQMKLMVQRLLADRFHLKFHSETRNMAAYVIGVGKTAPKLFPAKEGEAHALQPVPQRGPDQKIASYQIKVTRYSMAQLNDVLSRPLGAVIVDQTGLEGEYDFTLELTPDDSQRPTDPSLLLSAMREQLGLTVKYEKTPVRVFVIDSVEKVAAGN